MAFEARERCGNRLSSAVLELRHERVPIPAQIDDFLNVASESRVLPLSTELESNLTRTHG